MKRTNFQERSYVTTRYDREQYRKGINIVASGNYQYLKDTQYETLPTVSKKKKKTLSAHCGNTDSWEGHLSHYSGHCS